MLAAILFLLNTFLCFVVAHVAGQKNRSTIGFFFLSFVFSFLVGILVVLALPAKDPSKKVVKGIVLGKLDDLKCPHCNAPLINNSAICKACKTPTSLSQGVGPNLGNVDGSFQQAYDDSLKKRKKQ